MANYLTTDTDLTSVANAIRTKGGTSAQLAFPAGFVSAIGDIPTGGNLPFGLVKEKTLINTTFTADSNITESTSEVALYTLDPILQADYTATDFFFIFGYIAWKGSMAIEDISSSQFLSSANILSMPRTYGFAYDDIGGRANILTRYTSNWIYCANTGESGLYLNKKSASASSLVLKIQFSHINHNVVAKAGDYAVRADLYKFNPLQLEGSLA